MAVVVALTVIFPLSGLSPAIFYLLFPGMVAHLMIAGGHQVTVLSVVVGSVANILTYAGIFWCIDIVKSSRRPSLSSARTQRRRLKT